MSGESVRQRAELLFDLQNPEDDLDDMFHGHEMLDFAVSLAESESSLARKQALREAAQKVCGCCETDGDPEDLIGHSTATPAGDDGGPRFVHFYEDGERIDCLAEEIWPLFHERGRKVEG